MRLQGKVAVVTGAGRGIGLGIVQRLAAEGACVVANDLNQTFLTEAAAMFAEYNGAVLPVQADVSDAAQVAMLFAEAEMAFGVVEILVNNAANSAPVAHFLEMSESFWDTVLANNLKSVFLCSQCAARALVEKKKAGAIINISSVAATRAHRRMVAYDASKGGLEAATRAMALDLAPWNIRVNAVGPVAIATSAWMAVGDRTAEQVEAARALVPLQRLGTPEEVAAAVAFFASDDAAFVTGQVLYVDGGMSVQLRPASFE